MPAKTSIFFCLAYVVGLLLTGLNLKQPWLSGGILLGGVALEIGINRWQPGRFPRKFWLIITAITIVATCYYPLRVPQASAVDISQFVPVLRSSDVTIHGTVETLPRLTRSEKIQFWLRVEGLDAGPIAARLSQPPNIAKGRLYVTVPQAIGADIHPGLVVDLRGQLYLPQAAQNDRGFDFKQFLQLENCFAGLRGESLKVIKNESSQYPINHILWQIQRRIVQSQATYLPTPHGALVSAMVVGGRVVDLPFELKDRFAAVGLSHALAASGFQVSLILGVVLALVKSWDKRLQFGLGAIALLTFLGLTGLQPSVCRAVVMGFAVLIGVLVDRRTNPIGALLVAITLLLIANPLWIWDLGFQFSVLATLGLIVTVPWLSQRLDCLPERLIELIAVPIAAFIWTLPLQLYQFGVLSPYSIGVNILTAPIISLLSLGAMVNAMIAVMIPIVGSWTALALQPLTSALLTIVNAAHYLPGHSWAIGTIPLVMLLLLYGLLLALWWRPDWQRYGYWSGLAAVAMVWLPAAVWQGRLTQVTALATTDQPILVVQNRGRSGLINSGQEKTANLTIAPFLQQQGVKRLDWAIDLSKAPKSTAESALPTTGWPTIKRRFPITQHYHTELAQLPASQNLSIGQGIDRGQTRWERLSDDPTMLTLQVDQSRWLLLVGNRPNVRNNDPILPAHEVLWWNGGSLSRSFVGQIQPQIAIAYGKKLDANTENMLQQQGIPVFWLQRDGGVQWRQGKGMRSVLAGDAAGALL
jgi:competence protein ComEC